MGKEIYLTRGEATTHTKIMPDGPNRSPDTRPHVPSGVRAPEWPMNRVAQTPDEIAQVQAIHEKYLETHTDLTSADRDFLRALRKSGRVPPSQPGAENPFRDLGLTDPVLSEYAEGIEWALSSPIGIVDQGYLDRAKVLAAERQLSATGTDDEKRVIREEANRLLEEIQKLSQRIPAEPSEREKSENAFVRRIIDEDKFREDYFNNIFADVDQQPHREFNQAFNPLTFGAQYETFMGHINRGIRETEAALAARPGDRELDHKLGVLREDRARFTRERQVRETLHNMNYVLYIDDIKPEQLFGFMQKAESWQGDYAMRIPGVRQMMDSYERMLREAMIESPDGSLPIEDVTGQDVRKESPYTHRMISTYEEGKVTVRTKAYFRKLLAENRVYVTKEDGTRENVTAMTEEDINRVFIAARAMEVMTLRIISVAAESKLRQGRGQYGSLYLQDLLQGYSPFIHLTAKYGVTEKSLAMFLAEDSRGADLLRRVNLWNPKALVKAFQAFEHDPRAVLDHAKGFRFLARTNPNKAGDIFTWQGGWRFRTETENSSVFEKFLKRGQDNMRLRWDGRHANTNVPSAQTYEDFEKNLPDEERERLWQRTHHEAPSIKDYQRFRDEYSNWIGTGIRFEIMRNILSEFKPGEAGRRQVRELEIERDDRGRRMREEEEPEMRPRKRRETEEEADERRKSAKEKLETLEKGKTLVRKFVELQPHRLFIKSPLIRKRVFEDVDIKRLFITSDGKPDWEKIHQALDQLSMAESMLVEHREELLNKGIRFDEIEILNIESLLSTKTLAGFKLNEDAITLAKAVGQDYETYNTKEKGFLYDNEFIYNREYYHGFALWVDAPLDEGRFQDLGPTGSFARRARDNEHQTKVFKYQLDLLNKMKDIREIDELYDFLDNIHLEGEQYSQGFAKDIVAETAECALRFGMADWIDNFPGYGFLNEFYGHDSAARIFYGKTAPSWHPYEVREFLKKLRQKNRITLQQEKELKKKLFATETAVAVDLGATGGEIAAAALALYLLLEILKKD